VIQFTLIRNWYVRTLQYELGCFQVSQIADTLRIAGRRLLNNKPDELKGSLKLGYPQSKIL